MRRHRLKRSWLPNMCVARGERPVLELIWVGSQVRLGTVDIFQGQEAKIVIVSLVRNSGDFDTGNSSIGFLKVMVIPVSLRPTCSLWLSRRTA